MRERLKTQGSENNMSVAMRKFAQDYHRLSPQQWAKYEEIGSGATLSHRAGHKAFGHRPNRPRKKTLTNQRNVPASASRAMDSLTSKITQKRKATLMIAHAEVAKKEQMSSDIVVHCRESSGMPPTHEPLTSKQAVENVLSVTSFRMAAPSLVTKSFHVSPPNAKLTKARFGMIWVDLGVVDAPFNGLSPLYLYLNVSHDHYKAKGMVEATRE